MLLSDSSVSEAEVPLRRIAQVLYLIEVALECLVVCSANSTSGGLVTHAKYPSAGNHGIVNKGEANGGPPPPRMSHHIAPRSSDALNRASQKSICSSRSRHAWRSCANT